MRIGGMAGKKTVRWEISRNIVSKQKEFQSWSTIYYHVNACWRCKLQWEKKRSFERRFRRNGVNWLSVPIFLPSQFCLNTYDLRAFDSVRIPGRFTHAPNCDQCNFHHFGLNLVQKFISNFCIVQSLVPLLASYCKLIDFFIIWPWTVIMLSVFYSKRGGSAPNLFVILYIFRTISSEFIHHMYKQTLNIG